MNAFTSLNAIFFRFLRPWVFSKATLSLTNASWRIRTRGPLPERKTGALDSLIWAVATFKPMSVFPAPGTPVTKQIDFSCLSFDPSIICEIAFVVTARFSSASFFAISATVCPLYNALAASMIVGVGRYRPPSHFGTSIVPLPTNFRTLSIALIREADPHFSGTITLSLWEVNLGTSSDLVACVAMRIGAITNG